MARLRIPYREMVLEPEHDAKALSGACSWPTTSRPPAGVRQLLAAFPEFTVVGECRDGREVLAALDVLKPDVLFLDIQMPEIDGFEVIRRRTPERMPAVVFLTAYDQFAIRAFDAEAHDYLVKPVSEARFAATIKRLVKRLGSGDAAHRGSRHRRLDIARGPGAAAARDRLDRGRRQLRTAVDGRPEFPAARVAGAAGAARARARLRAGPPPGAGQGRRRPSAARERGGRARRRAGVRSTVPVSRRRRAAFAAAVRSQV